MKNTLLALFTAVLGWSSAFGAVEDKPDVLEKDGIFYELLYDENGEFTFNVNVVGWADGMTELDIPDEVELTLPAGEEQNLSRQIGTGETWTCTVIIFFTKYYGMAVPNDSRNIDKILLGSNIRVNGSFSDYPKLRNISLPSKATEIPDSMFYGCRSLTSITIPPTVNTIGMGAFADCVNLETVSFQSDPSSMAWKYVYSYAFQNCASLRAVTLPGSINVLSKAFDSCDNLEYVSFGDGGAIDGNPFTRCPKLTSVAFGKGDFEVKDGLVCDKKYGVLHAAFPSTISDVTIPTDIKEISGDAFAYCANLRHIFLPYQIKKIGYNAFAYSGLESLDTEDLSNFGESGHNYRFEGCANLAKVRVGKNFSRLDPDDFRGCNALKGFVVDAANETYETENGVLYTGAKLVCVPAGLDAVSVREGTTSTSEYSFSASSKLASVKLPESLEWIGDNSFQGCNALKSLVVPENVGGVFSGTFCFCTSLEELTLKGVRQFRDWAFDGCDNLKSLYVHTPEPPTAYYSYEEDGVFPDVMLENTTVYVPDGSIDKYRASSLWSRFKSIKGISASIEVSESDSSEAPLTEVFNLSGIKIANTLDNLTPGIYIIRQGSKVTKKAVN